MNRQQLIEDNMNLVYFLVNKHYPLYIKDEDIVQSGMVGLCKAADAWDESKSEFSTYAGKCILNEINMEFRRRKKHLGVWSLEHPVANDEGEIEFGELLVGDLDIDYVDLQPLYDRLAPKEREALDLLKEGLSQREVSAIMGVSQPQVCRYAARIKILWREIYGD